ncbi:MULTISPECIES: hypothetical protein [Nocardia]|uniref:Uncharacterized protein n=1 Tax=Nocardia aurea TaxID=2144174 RepID=A0ABV3FRG9_9NOCA|nr:MULTISPECIES: hypothetical protein [Nocardia]
MDVDGTCEPRSSPSAPRGFAGQAGAEFFAAFRDGLDRAIAMLDDLDESGVVLARLELAAAQRAREGVPIEAVRSAVSDSVRMCFGLIEPTAAHSVAGMKVDGVRMVEVLDLLTAAVDRAYGMRRGDGS